jgi:hypothetical protein
VGLGMGRLIEATFLRLMTSGATDQDSPACLLIYLPCVRYLACRLTRAPWGTIGLLPDL